MKLLKKILLFVVLPLCVLTAAGAGGAWWWVHRPLDLPRPAVEFVVPAGSGPAAVARGLDQAGVKLALPVRGVAWLARLTGQDKLLKAGAYEARQGDTLLDILDRVSRGDMIHRQITFVEGWTYRQIRAALANNTDVRQTLAGKSDQDVLSAIGAGQTHPEGLFFPDTYVFVPGTSDLDLLRTAYQAQVRELDKAWVQREADLPLKTPYEALILASIIEKETGHGPERSRIGGVFINRLRIGMPLQTDPTVIYGMGDAYEGRIRKRDLLTDTPWNTYTRSGLPPTPIAAPGREALMAAVRPEQQHYLYFVSRGDGTSEFADSLDAHNRTVRHYILGKK